jgi:hypothetical protein
MSLLLDNAILSIQLGLEDFASADDRRMISAVRNLYGVPRTRGDEPSPPWYQV